MGMLLRTKANEPYFSINVRMAEILKLLEFTVDLLGSIAIAINPQCGVSVNNAIRIVDSCFVMVNIVHPSIFTLAEAVQRKGAAIPSTTIV